MRILAVDDDEPTLEILGILLARLGFAKMVEAVSAKEAMESIKNSPIPYDCILLDMQMPDMDGIELCARLRKLSDYARCPIINKAEKWWFPHSVQPSDCVRRGGLGACIAAQRTY
ncbi:response regulator [uncultured Marivita sp.]|uniref:response regulator n=1 Tax=uncultured Marivita sp. TaxID=888080 RepID=UPI00262304B3|nr:response regulator [uncultured Marivita sp.]